ncbi:PAS domain S-box protein [Azonexus sp.]|uniref:PAS domain S-box protein n=1 Tax=Azonexus sp. TaxID=1872668 RepID=UPI0035AEDC58
MTPSRRLRVMLVASLVLANIAVIALAIQELHPSFLQYESRARVLTQNTAAAADQNVSSSVDKIDLALRTVADELERQLAATGRIDPASMNAFLLRHEQRLPEVEAFRVADADGLVFLGKGVDPAARASWADREYFSWHRDDPAHGLFVAPPRMGRVARQPIIGFSRRYNHPDGRFAGVVSAPIAITHFNRLLAGYELGAAGTIVLRYGDRGLITRLPPLPDKPAGKIGDTTLSPELNRLIDNGTPSATYYTATSADGYRRIVTFRRLEKAPMFVIAGVAESDYLADWWTELRQTVAMVAGFVLLSVLAGILLVRQLNRAEAREYLLRDSLDNGRRKQESLRRLNEVAALSHLPLDRQVHQALEIGSRLLDLEFGIVSQVQGDDYCVLAQVSPPDTLHDGDRFPLGNTYCCITLAGDDVLAIAHMGASPHAGHPCYEAFRLEAYIGAPIRIEGQVFGTVNFSSPNPYPREFDDTDREFIALLARWVASAIERERASQKLAASQQRLHDIIENEPECVAVLDLDGRIREMNRAGLAMLEADSPDAVIGRNFVEFIVPADREFSRSFAQGIGRGESGTLECEIVGLRGGQRWLETHAVPMREPDGTVTGLLGVTRDVTERRQTQAELEVYRRHLEELVEQRSNALLATEARATHILQSSADGLYGVDARGRITFINAAACRMLGYTEAQAIGCNSHQLFHHSRPDGTPYPAAECPSHDALRQGRTVRVDSEVYWHADGRPVPVMYAIHPMIENGKTTGAVISFIDASAQRAAAEARERAVAAAENLARVRSEFLANMSHEIRTPLNGVLGFAEIGLRHAGDPDKAANAFAKIMLSGRRLLGVINDVLDFSKIEAGKLSIEQTRVVLAEVVEHAVDLVRESAAAKGIALRARLAGDLPADCVGDPLRIGQVLLNLLSNAVKFTEEGSVDLDVRRVGDELVFRVADTGIGMDEAQQAELFNPFHQADASSTRRFGGTGLGLAISKRILELMDGSIELASRPGDGTTVEFRLPYRPFRDAAPAAAAAALPAVPAKRPLAGLRCLVAEDEEINRLVIGENLEEAGASVVLVGNGREAVERVEADGPAAYDLVLMDLQMPEMDGYAAAGRIAELAPGLPVVAQTAHAFNEERERCLAAGMVDHLAKPIDPDALVDIVRRHARRG